ncbi:uncharacterized protein LOC144619196 [Crassostrea virginica]
MASNREILMSELEQVKQKLPNIEGVTLEGCLPEIVRLHIYVDEMRQMTCVMQFLETYPTEPVVVELKSKTLTEKLLDGVVKLCDAEARKYIGQKQVILLVNFLKQFLIDNPLCIVNDEVGKVKKELLSDEDKCKLMQSASQVLLKVREEEYYMSFKISVPAQYPKQQIQLEITENNFPDILKINFLGQAIEIARQCVQPPLKKKPKEPPFEPKPSLYPVCEYLIKECIKRYAKETCPLCNERVLPQNPEDVTKLDKRKRIERVYCGHLFHYFCLYKFMKSPPFSAGKFCPTCGKQIFHDKFKVSAELQEARWAHKQARQRELAEVVDFLE